MRNLRAAACKRMHKLDRDLQTAPLARMILTKPPVRRATHPLREATGNLDEFRIRRRDLIGGVIHEYAQAAGPWQMLMARVMAWQYLVHLLMMVI
jgi:hypothetical protein